MNREKTYWFARGYHDAMVDAEKMRCDTIRRTSATSWPSLRRAYLKGYAVAKRDLADEEREREFQEYAHDVAATYRWLNGEDVEEMAQ
jgi:hypothetical protein